MLTARDIMTEDVVTVRAKASISEAMEQLVEHEITGMPVVDDEMRLKGMVTEKDLLRLYDKPWRVEEFRVEDFMTMPAVHFEEDESFEDVCDCLLNNVFRRVPVTFGNKVVGVISRPDIIKYILQHKDDIETSKAKNKEEG